MIWAAPEGVADEMGPCASSAQFVSGKVGGGRYVFGKVVLPLKFRHTATYPAMVFAHPQLIGFLP